MQPQGLHEQQQQRRKVLEDRVTSVLLAVSEKDRPLTIAEVARRAGVSRQFIHVNDHIHLLVRDAISRQRSWSASEHEGLEQSSDARQRAKSALALLLEARTAERDAARQQVRELQEHRQKWLGLQLDQAVGVDAVIHAEVVITRDKLMDDNRHLLRQRDEQKNQIERLSLELQASREANQDLAEALSDQSAILRPEQWRKE